MIEIDPHNWERAREWARAHAKAFELRTEGWRHAIELVKVVPAIDGTISLRFDRSAGTQPEQYLSAIHFKVEGDPGPACWIGGSEILDTPQPPATLSELIEREKVYPDDRRTAHEVAEAHPEFDEVYEEIIHQLFPKSQHWELTSAPEEDYLECLTRDAAIIRRLKNV